MRLVDLVVFLAVDLVTLCEVDLPGLPVIDLAFVSRLGLDLSRDLG